MNKSYWMKPYIMQKSNVKKYAKDEFKKDFLKLINSRVFGKTMGKISNY